MNPIKKNKIIKNVSLVLALIINIAIYFEFFSMLILSGTFNNFNNLSKYIYNLLLILLILGFVISSIFIKYSYYHIKKYILIVGMSLLFCIILLFIDFKYL
jgi:hypothetical protein